MSCFCAQIFNESQRELLRDERVRVSLEFQTRERHSGIAWARFVLTFRPALVNAVVSVGGERESLARAAKDDEQRDEGRNREP